MSFGTGMPMPRAPVPLFKMSVPLGVSARRQSDNERFSTLSKITSYRLPPRVKSSVV